MHVASFRRLAAAAVFLALAPLYIGTAGEIHSSMRNVRAVVETQGFSIQPAYDVEPSPDSADLAPPQLFEIARPFDKAVTIGRLFTSCSCIQLEAAKRTFMPGERAVLHLRNIRPTPPAGQVYAIFVQITSPIRATLRFDTFVKTGMDEANHNPGAANHAEPSQDVTNDPPEDIEDENVDPHEEPSMTEERPLTDADVVDVDSIRGNLQDILAPKVEEAEQAVGETAAAARDAIDEYFNRGDAPAAPADSLPEFETAAPLIPPSPTPPPPAADTRPPAPPPAAIVPPEEPPTAPTPSTIVPSALTPPPQRDPNAQRPVQLVSLITVGVRDMSAAIRFYEALGWQRAARGKYDQTAFFQLQGQVLALYPIADLLREQNMVGASPSPGGITLALHVADRADVWSVYERFVDAGGTSLRPPAEMASGAVTSYVADPDGNAWEISWVPQFRIDEDGGLWLP